MGVWSPLKDNTQVLGPINKITINVLKLIDWRIIHSPAPKYQWSKFLYKQPPNTIITSLHSRPTRTQARHATLVRRHSLPHLIQASFLFVSADDDHHSSTYESESNKCLKWVPGSDWKPTRRITLLTAELNGCSLFPRVRASEVEKYIHIIQILKMCNHH